MSEPLVTHLDPAMLADRGRTVRGHVDVTRFRRLADMLASTDGRIEAELRFAIDEQQRRVLHGHLRGNLWLTCQRCLTPFALPVDQAVELVMVGSAAEADLLPDEIDAVVIGEQREVHAVDLIEDELILALPLIARCGRGDDCTVAAQLLDADSVEAAVATQRPFAGLGREGDDGSADDGRH